MPLLADQQSIFRGPNASILLQRDDLVCIPGRATFTMNNTWEGNKGDVVSRTVSVDPISPLMNLTPLTHDNEILVPGFCQNGTDSYGTAPANWSTYASSYYRDNNMMAITDSMMLQLSGSYMAELQTPPSLLSATDSTSSFSPSPNTSLVYGDLLWNAFVGEISSSTGFDTGGKYHPLYSFVAI
jgi:hypothetical protein